MNKVLFNISVDLFIQLHFQLSKYLESSGYSVTFLSFLPRESLWLTKNKVEVLPSDVYTLKNYEIDPNVLSVCEMEEILRFSILKIGGQRKVWEARALRIATYINKLLVSGGFEAVLIWNGEDFQGKILSILAKRKKVRTVFIENGYFPRTLQCDPAGVNVYSSLTKLPFAEICRALETKQGQDIKKSGADFELAGFAELTWADYLKCFMIRKLNFNYYRDFPENRGASWFTSQWLKIKRQYILFDKVEISEKYIFVPFQVHDDTQILLNSKYFKRMEDFFEFTYATIKRHFGDEYKIVVKEHPEDICRYSYASLRSKYPDVIWLRKYNIDKLLDHASYVFVVNSSVGLQAMQRFKPVIVFGDSFYTRDELVFCVNDPAAIDGVVARAKQGVDAARRKNIETFIRYLKEQCFVEGGWKDLTAQGVVNAGNKILSFFN